MINQKFVSSGFQNKNLPVSGDEGEIVNPLELL